MLNLLALLCGILAVSHFPALPALHPLFFVIVALLLRARRLRWLGFLGAGLWWGIFAGQQLLERQLPQHLEGVDLKVRGDIIDLPDSRENGQRFLFRIDQAESFEFETAVAGDTLPANVLLTAYDNEGFAVGQRLQLVVRLKRPRALVNEGGFDYHRWLLSRDISATGYIRQSPHNRELAPDKSYPLQQFRAHIRAWIVATADPALHGPLLALAIGDNSRIAPEQWQLFQQTGTGHLMAISGLHVGLVAVFGLLLGRGITSLLSMTTRQWRWLRYLPNFLSCAIACGYAGLAGFGLPTQRALVMVLMLNLAFVIGRGHQPLRAMALAALVVLLLDPLAGLDMGFWLSFGAVAVLIGFFQFRRGIASAKSARVAKAQNFLRAQLVVFIGIFIPLLVFNTPLSLLSPLANLVAIPLISLLVVIPLLLGIVSQGLGLGLADYLLDFAGLILQGNFHWLTGLVSLDLPNRWSPGGPSAHLVWVPAALFGIAMLIMARGFPGRWLGALLFIPVLLPAPRALPPLSATVLDVGQGLAVVVRTPDHTLLYDAGAKFSERFDTGDAVVLAYLRFHGIRKLDTMIISHGDNDHAGGAPAVVTGVAVDEIIVGEALPQLPQTSTICDRNLHWRWQEVDFRLIEPRAAKHGDNNNLSCVLLVSYKGQHLLLPGDIEAPVERALIAENRLPQPLQTVIAPHHGSRTSSTRTFVNTLRPKTAIFSAAYRSRYGHPHPHVTERYQQIGAGLYNTAQAGQIDLVWDAAGRLKVSGLRQRRPRYWY